MSYNLLLLDVISPPGSEDTITACIANLLSVRVFVRACVLAVVRVYVSADCAISITRLHISNTPRNITVNMFSFDIKTGNGFSNIICIHLTCALTTSCSL